MKHIPKHLVIIITIFFTSVSGKQGTPSSTIPAHPSKILFDSLDWEVPLGSPFRETLDNGSIAYIAKDSSLPLINLTIYIRHGSIADPMQKKGLAVLWAAMMRSGGTQKYPADTLDEIIDLHALKIGFTADPSQCTVNASFLSEYTDTVFTLLREMLYYPVFDAKKLEKERTILIETIQHRFDNPEPTLGYAYLKQMYSAQAPLASEASLKKITRNDLIALHHTIISPANMIICISGSFDRTTMKNRLEALLKNDAPIKEITAFRKIVINRPIGVLLVHRPISQAYVRLGLPLFKRPHPDFYAMSILNEILGGGGFTSRLGQKIRSDEGLTYSIRSQAESNYTYPGTFRIDFFTKNESFAQAVSLTLTEVKKLIATGVTDEELANAKSSLLGELPSMFRSPGDIVSTYGWNEYYHRAPDHFRVYPKKIRAISKKDLSRVAETYLKPDSMAITVVGDSTALLHQKSGEFSLAKLQPKVILPETIPTLP